LTAGSPLVTLLAGEFPGRAIHVVADAAYHGPAVKTLPASVTWRRSRLALVTTDLAATATAVITRYAALWSIEQATADARILGGRGPQPHPPRRRAHHPVRHARLHPDHHLVRPARSRPSRPRRAAQPWCATKTQPAFEDMLTQLRRTLITARISGGSPAQPAPAQIQAVLAAWHAAAA